MQPDNLTIDKLLKVKALINTVYYATDNRVDVDKIYQVPKSKYNPEFFVCHPDKFDDIKKELPEKIFVHISDYHES